jgi:type I restriction enzyme M protein
MNKQKLANTIWESANKLRSKIDANEYKDFILGFMFYKYLSEMEENLLKSWQMSEEELVHFNVDEADQDVQVAIQEVSNTLGYFISYKDLFSTWLKEEESFSIANVRDALRAFNQNIAQSHKPVFNKIFDMLEVGLSKLGESTGAQTKAAKNLIKLIDKVPMHTKQDYDVLGFIYEYLISQFAASAGKKAGEFYTPHEVALLMSEIVAYHLRDRHDIKIYDPTSGSGSLLINIGKCVAKHTNDPDRIKYYAQEINENTYNLSRMNLVMRGITPANLKTRRGDTLEEDWPYFDESDPAATYEPLYVDAVVSNPPYSQQWDPEDKESDARFARFGLAPKSKADFAFLLHDLFHLKPDGIMTIVLPHGVLFRGGEEAAIRQNLIEFNNIDAVIGLPSNIFFGTGIPTIIMVLKQTNREDRENIYFIDASKGFEKDGKNNKLRASDIKRITDAFISRDDIPGFARRVSRDEIRQNGYNLNIPRYVNSSESEESYDLYSLMFGGIANTDINRLQHYWDAYPNLKAKLFNPINASYSSLVDREVQKIIESDSEVKSYKSSYEEAITSIKSGLKNDLVNEYAKVSLNCKEDEITDKLFAKLSDFPLFDRYEVYEEFHSHWLKISADLEVLQSEGLGAAREYGFNDELGINDGKIIPVDFVQNYFLGDLLNEIESERVKLDAAQESIAEEFDSLSEEEKCYPVFSEDGSKFDKQALNKWLKGANKEEETVFYTKVQKVKELLTSEANIKKLIKDKTAELGKKTEESYAALTDKDIFKFLETKWIEPLFDSLLDFPNRSISTLENEIISLADKCGDSLLEVENKITEAEKELNEMLGELTGNSFDMEAIKQIQSLLGAGK